MLNNEDFDRIDSLEETGNGLVNNINTSIQNFETDMLKTVFKGLSNASFNVFTGIEGAIADVPSYIMTGQGLTKEEKQNLPLTSFVKPYQDFINKSPEMQYKSGAGQMVGAFAEPAIQFGASFAASPSKYGKVATMAKNILANAFSSGFAFKPEDPNIGDFLASFDNKTAKAIGEVFAHDPDDTEWDMRLKNIIADSAAAKVASGVGKAGKAIATNEHVLAALRYIWKGKKSKAIEEGIESNIKNLAKREGEELVKVITEEGEKFVTKSEAQKINPELLQGFSVREHETMNIAERTQQLKDEIKASMGISPENIDLDTVKKINDAQIPKELVDKSIVDSIALDNASNNIVDVLDDIGRNFNEGKISSDVKTRQEVEAINKLIDTEINWVDDLSDAGRAANVKSKNENAAAVKSFREWLQANASDGVKIDEISDFLRTIPKDKIRDALYMISKNKKLLLGKESVNKMSFGEIVDNINALRQAILLTDPVGMLKDIKYTGVSILTSVPETLVGSLISKGQKLHFKNADNVLKRGLNQISEFLFGSGEFTNSMDIREAWYQLQGIAKGTGENLKEISSALKHQSSNTLTSKFRQNIPNNVSAYNQNRITSITLPKFSGKTKAETAVNTILEGLEATGKSLNIREMGDNVTQSVAARGVLEQRLMPIINSEEFKGLSKAEKKALYADYAEKIIQMIPEVNNKRIKFETALDQKLYGIAKDVFEESTKQVFRDPLEGFTKKMYDISNHESITRYIKMFEPFIKTRLSIYVDRVLRERTPVGLFSSRIQSQLSAGGRTAAMARARIAIGSSLGGWLASKYHLENRIDGGYTKLEGTKDGLSADYSDVNAVRSYQKALGFVPYSMKMGNKRVKLEDLFGVYGDVISDFLRASQTYTLFYDKIHSQENVMYDEDGYMIDPDISWQALAMGFGLVMTNAVGRGSYIEDLGILLDAVDREDTEMLEEKVNNAFLPVPPVFQRVADLGYVVGNMITDDNFFDYRQWQQAANTWTQSIWDRLGGRTKEKLSWRGKPMQDWMPGAALMGMGVKSIPENDIINEEIAKEQAFVQEPTNSVTITPSETGLTKRVRLSDDQVEELKNIMGTYTFVMPDTGKKVRGVDGALLDLFKSEKYQNAPGAQPAPKRLNKEQKILLNPEFTKKSLIRERYNLIKKMATEVLYRKDEKFRKDYAGIAVFEGAQLDIPTAKNY